MDRAFTIHKPYMEKLTAEYELPKGKAHHTTMLWARASEVAAITNTQPKRWLRYGVNVLDRALIHLKEKSGVKNRGAFLTWAIRYHNEEG